MKSFAIGGVVLLSLILLFGIITKRAERPAPFSFEGNSYWIYCKQCSVQGYWEWRILKETGSKALTDLSWCESKLGTQNHCSVDRGKTWGLFCFAEPTFLWMSGEAGITNPNRFNNVHQILAAKWALENKKMEHWLVCSRKLKLL